MIETNNSSKDNNKNKISTNSSSNNNNCNSSNTTTNNNNFKNNYSSSNNNNNPLSFICIIFLRFVSVVLPLVFSGVLEYQAMGRPAPAATTALARPRQPNVFQGQLLKPTIHFWAPQFRENSFQKVEKIFLLHFNFNYFQCDQKKLLNVYIKVVQK